MDRTTLLRLSDRPISSAATPEPIPQRHARNWFDALRPTFANSAPDLSIRVPHPERVARRDLLFLGAPPRSRMSDRNGPTMMPRPAGVEGWLPIAGLMNLKYWLSRPHSGIPSRGHVSVCHFSGHSFPVAQGLLQLALPRRNSLGISLACRTRAYLGAISFAALA